MPEETEVLDTQEETTDETLETEDEESKEDTIDGDSTEEEDEPLDMGLEPDDEIDTQSPLSDLIELIKTNPEAAVLRASQVSDGLVKLQAQKEEAESFVRPIQAMFEGFAKRDAESINEFERVLYENTNLTLEDLIAIQGGTSPQQRGNDPKVETLEKRLDRIEQERAATDWITSTGAKSSAQIAKVTGLEFSPEVLWQARQYLKPGAGVDDVRKAVMRVNPDAYDKAVAKRDGVKEPVPKGASMPTGRGGVQRTFAHTPEGFLAAREAKLARSGKG